MDLLNLSAKITLDTSDYEKGIKEASDAGKDVEKSLKNTSSEAKTAEKQYKTTGSAAKEYGQEAKSLSDNLDDATDSQKSLTKEVKESGSGFSSIKDKITSTVSGLSTFAKAGGVAVGALTAVGAGLNAIEEATEEYRIAQGKLNTAFEAAGYSADVATGAYQDLYAIIGDTDTATEAAQLMAKLSDSVEDFSEWTDIAAGVAGTFGDALPINSLIEAANETSKVGEVVGVLADALNWAGISEDDFNAALAACTDEADRNQLIMDTLSQTYDEATDAFYRNNEEVVAARENQARLDDALSDVGDSVSSLKNSLLNAFTPAIETATGATEKFVNWLAQAIDKMGQSASKYSAQKDAYKAYQTAIASGKTPAEAQAAYTAAWYSTDYGATQRPQLNEPLDYAASRASSLGIGKTGLAASVQSAITSGIPDAVKQGSSDVIAQIEAAGEAAENAAAKSTAATKTAVEKQKTLYEQLTEQYKSTYSGLSAELSNSETEYQIWSETVGDSVSEADKLQKQLESLNEQHSIQEEAVKAAQEAYDAYAASEGASEEEAAALYNTVLKQKLALAQLQTEIDGTAQAYNEATDKAKQYADALEEGMSAAGDLGGSLSTLGGIIEDLGTTTENEGITSFGQFLSMLGGGIGTILSVISAVQNLAGALQTLSSVSGTVNALGGLSGAATGGAAAAGGATVAGGASLLAGGALALAAVGGVASGISTTKKVIDTWKDESKSTGEKIVESAGELLWGLSPIGGITNLVSDLFGSKKSSDTSTTSSASTASYSTSYTPTTTTTTTGNGVTVIQNIYSEAKTSAELMREARYEQERAVLMA